MKNKLLLPLIFVSILTSCSSGVIIKSPSEDSGLEGNADLDIVEQASVDDLKNLLKSVAKKTRYSFDVNINIPGYEEHFTHYVTPYALYEKADKYEDSIGYAQTKDGYIFKYYLTEDEKEVYPSIYEYAGLSGEIEKIKGLYGPFSFAHISMLADSMNDFSAIKISANKYSITDSTTASVFQYMTNYGTSISNYLVGFNIEVISFETEEFNIDIDLGQAGSINCKFVPLETTMIDFVSNACFEGTLKGVDYYEETGSFFNMVKENNYVLEGIKQEYYNGTTVSTFPYKINCTNDYFYLSYTDEYKNMGYKPFGFTLVKKGTTVTFKTYNAQYEEVEVTQTLDYDACYKFSEDSNENLYYSGFVGPVETSNIDYLELDKLPTTGEKGVLYIVPNENGKKIVYEWVEGSTGEYTFIEYSTWYDNVGDFPINDIGATFYLSGTPLASIGAYYFEKDNSNNHVYYSKDRGITSSLANGLFGWGYQNTTTWTSYVTKANLKLNYEEDRITSADLGVSVLADVPNVGYGEQKIFYTIKDFGLANIDKIERFINGGN